MAERLFIRLSHPVSDCVEWAISDENNTLITTPHLSPLSDLSDKAIGREVIIIIPGIALQIQHTTIPKTSSSNLLKALPFALEEKLVMPIDQMHFAIIKKEQNRQTVAVVAREQMNSWKELLANANIDADQWIPDLAAVSGTAWQILIDKEEALCSCDGHFQFTTDSNNVIDLLELYIGNEQLPLPHVIDLIIFNEEKNPFFDDIHSVSGIPIKLTYLNVPTISYLIQHFPLSKEINLLQGDYRPTHKLLFTKRIIQLACFAVILWVFSFIAKDGQEYFSLHRQQNRLQQQIESIYKNIFPTATSVMNPRLRFERELIHLEFGSGGGDFLSLLSDIAPIVRQTIEREADSKLQNLEYKNKQISLKMSAPRFEIFDNLSQALKKKGLYVEQQDARREEGAVTSTLLIRKRS